MAECVTRPTLTREVLQTDSEVVTVTQTSTTTEPPTTETITLTITDCPTVSGSSQISASCVISLSTSLTTIPGEEITNLVPVVETNFVTSTDFTTLFTTSCTTPEDPTPSPTEDPTTSFDPPPSTSTTTSTNESLTTASQTPTTTAASSTSDEPSNTPGSVASNDNQRSQPNVGAIVGGSLGGLAGLLVILGIIWFFIKRRRRWDDLFDSSYDHYIIGRKRNASHNIDLEPEWDTSPAVSEPKPYEYGAVGGPPPPSLFSSPPDSSSSSHDRRPSVVPLASSLHGHHHDPSTSHSLRGSISAPPVTNAPSDAHLPNIPSPKPGSTSHSRPTTSSTIASEASQPSPAPLPPPSPVAPLINLAPVDKRPTFQRQVTADSVASSVDDYPLHRGGVLQVTNADLPKSPLYSNPPPIAESQPSGAHSKAAEAFSDPDVFDPATLFGPVEGTSHAQESSRPPPYRL